MQTLLGRRASRAASLSLVLLSLLGSVALGLSLPGTVPSAVAADANGPDRVLALDGGFLGSDSCTSDGIALTCRGRGEFSSLAVTVSKTTNLVNEAVQVTWTGGAPTLEDYYTDFLQIMQCWGDERSEGPDRTHCQYGVSGLDRGNLGRREVGPWDIDPFDLTKEPGQQKELWDPAEPLTRNRSTSQVYVPFTAAKSPEQEGQPDQTVNSNGNEFFQAGTTTEVPQARTSADGTGRVAFEMQTGREASGLRCGSAWLNRTTGRVEPSRPCWLVVVPRGKYETNGNGPRVLGAHALTSSPLSTTNWEQRIVFPLSFTPSESACAIDRASRAVVGQEQPVDAVTRWQPALCADGGPTFTYSQVNDTVARRKLTTPTPDLVLTSRGVNPATVPTSRPVVYAPVALSGLTIAFNVERQPKCTGCTDAGSVAARRLTGTRVDKLVLSPRLVAKLLTQSYQAAVPSGMGRELEYLAKNPLNLGADKDFIALNPEFQYLRLDSFHALTTAGVTDAAGTLWRWILSDPEAKAFIDGQPDPWGMTVNRNYRGLSATDSFPRSDQTCAPKEDPQPPLCALDYAGYANDFHDAGRSASRGDLLTRATWNANGNPPSYTKDPPQRAGVRAVLAITDVPTAIRYSLGMATLRDSAGNEVAPTTASLLAGYAAMVPSEVPQVLQADPETLQAIPAAYPLTTVTYAATAPAALTADQRRDYAAFLEYAAGPGQIEGFRPGTLPQGYAPLPAALRSQTEAVVAALRNYVAPSPSPSPSRSPSPSPSPSRTASPSPTPTRSPSPSPSPSASPSPSSVQAAPSPSRGPASPVPAASPSPSPTPAAPGGGTSSTSGGSTGSSSTTVPSGATATSSPAPPPATSASPAPAPTGAPLPPVANVSAVTPGTALGAGRHVLLGVLVVGLLAAAAGPVLRLLADRPRK
ncbi:hypothetical protein [Motilibacter aurantiacus]|uniref:hypothetical protein n=1 Tax=Motilibacter aurantiacus TaxID=2714955 RepID=UPI0014085B38|nr:hypothetical protein [Motilibacter aurantiacus]NHC47228.1 hypothetical protein [Motilibacter aurantiacus]